MKNTITQKTAPMYCAFRGRKLVPIETVNQASAIMRKVTSDNNLGGSQTPKLVIYGADKKEIGYVSYNGRVWRGEWPNNELIYDPTSSPFGRERAAEGCVFEQPQLIEV